jgi:hypothetical protein
MEPRLAFQRERERERERGGGYGQLHIVVEFQNIIIGLTNNNKKRKTLNI